MPVVSIRFSAAPVHQRLEDSARKRCIGVSTLALSAVDAALDYYAEHAEEIDAELAVRQRAAAEAEAAWKRQRELLAKCG